MNEDAFSTARLIKGRSTTILVVDDEPAILDALEDLLEDDFRVLKATSGADGLRLLEDNTVSVVLSDQKMPGMKGEEFLAKVAENHVTTRVLLTGYTDFDDLVRAVNRGHIYAFVSKPWSPHQLRSLVKAAAERFDLERELVHEKLLLNLLLENIPDLISIKDAQGRYLRLNTACAQALQVDNPQAPLGKTDKELGSHLFEGAPERENAVLEGAPPDTDVTEKALWGPHWFSTTRVATPSVNGAPLLIGISREITERLESNRRLQKHAHQLERINEELSRFSFIVAHHLQEPLRSIASFTDLLRRRSLLKEGAEEYGEFIVANVRRAKSLMRDFSTYLDLYQIEPKITLSMAKAATSAIASLAAPQKFQEQIQVRGDATVRGHQKLISGLFIALLDNTLVHGGGGKEVVVTLTSLPPHGAIVTIDDHGPGIPDDSHDRVFGLFETLGAEERSGLGLALCQKIVELHNGEISLENRATGGLRVKFTIADSEELEQTSPQISHIDFSPTASTATPPKQQDNDADREQLERWKAFSATAAHDLHEPLRMVTSYLKLLERREGAQLTDDGREYLQYAVDGAQRMKTLLDGLLSYSASGKPGKEKRALSDILSDVLRDLKVAIADHQAELTYNDLPTLYLETVSGHQLLLNLIANAIKYKSEAPPQITISVEQEGEETVLTVADNGPGVSKELLANIFEPFVRGEHPTARGTGLGLATCGKIVKQWKGRIWCEANPGGGSRFRLTLPASAHKPT